MDKYFVRIWYRYRGGDEKDFFEQEIEAESIEDLVAKAKALRRNTTRIYNFNKKNSQWEKIN